MYLRIYIGGVRMLITVYIPCYRSAKMIERTVGGIKEEFQKHPEHDVQFVLVNDGSPDNTYEVIAEMARVDKSITAINLSRNFGQSNAKMAGLKYVHGDMMIYMDDDGLHDPADIYKLVDKINEGYDIVYVHFKKKAAGFFKKLTSNMHNKVAELMGTKLKGVHRSPFFAWSRFCIEKVKEYHSPFPAVGAYLLNFTTKFANVEGTHRKRMEGKSGYNLKKSLLKWANSVTNFTLVPLRLATFCGFGLCALSALEVLGMLIYWIFASFSYLTLILAFITLFAGLIMIFIGILGEVVGRMYMMMSEKPQYCIREGVNMEEYHEENRIK